MGSSLTDQYEPYTFDDDAEGPGCGIAHHEPSCLCDVDLSLSPAAAGNAPSLAFASLAKRGLYERDIPPTFENFAAELLGLFEKAREVGVRLKATPSELEELRSAYWEKIGAEGTDRRSDQLCNAEVRALLAAGLTVGACVRFLERPRSEVLGQVTTAHATAGLNATEDAIDMLLAGATSYHAVERATGVSFQRVALLAAAVGVESEATARCKRGGGYRYTAEQYKQIETLYAAGDSYTVIAEKSGVARAAVAKYVARKLRDAA